MWDDTNQRLRRSRNGRPYCFCIVLAKLLLAFVLQTTQGLLLNAPASTTLQRVPIENNHVTGVLTKQQLHYCSGNRLYYTSLLYDFETVGWDPFDPAPTSNLEICLKSRITTQQLAYKASQAKDHVCPATPLNAGIEMLFQTIIDNRQATMTLTVRFHVPHKERSDGSVRPPAVFSMLLTPSFTAGSPLVCAVVTPCDMWNEMAESLKFQEDVRKPVRSEMKTTAEEHLTAPHPTGSIDIVFAATLPHHDQFAIVVDSVQIVTLKLALTQFPQQEPPLPSTTSTSSTLSTHTVPSTSSTPSRSSADPTHSNSSAGPTQSTSRATSTHTSSNASPTDSSSGATSTHTSSSVSATKRVRVSFPPKPESSSRAATSNKVVKDESLNTISKDVYKDERINAIPKDVYKDESLNAIRKDIYKDDSLNAIQKDSNRRRLLEPQAVTQNTDSIPGSSAGPHPGNSLVPKTNTFRIPSVGRSILLSKTVCPFDYTCPVDRISLVPATRPDASRQRRRQLQEVVARGPSVSRITIRNTTRRITTRRSVLQRTRIRATSKSSISSSPEDLQPHESKAHAVLNKKVEYIVGVMRSVYKEDGTMSPIAYDLATCIPWPLPEHLQANVRLTEYRLVEFLVPPTLLERQALLSVHPLSESHKHVVITTRTGFSLRRATNGTQTETQTTEPGNNPQKTSSPPLHTPAADTEPAIRSSLSVRLRDLHPDIEKNKPLFIGMGCAGGALIGLLVFASLRYRRWASANAKQHPPPPPAPGVPGNRPPALQSDYTLPPQDDEYNSEVTMGSHMFTRWHDSVPSFGYSMYGVTDDIASTAEPRNSMPAERPVAVPTSVPHRASVAKQNGAQQPHENNLKQSTLEPQGRKELTTSKGETTSATAS